jgi:CRISPR-associated protein Cas1
MDDLHILPKVRDGLSFLYVEYARIDQYDLSIGIWQGENVTPVPAASLAVLSVGPGSTITHAAIKTLAENNCLVIWSGQQNVRFYAMGAGGTRSAAALIHQAKLACNEDTRLEVVKAMYRIRFPDQTIPDDVTVDVLRGMEGQRVRKAYAEAADTYGIEWRRRAYDRTAWDESDPVNRALSCANSCLYGICHAAILAAGFSPALGFVHTGKQLSFVYDIADLYKTDMTVPIAFKASSQSDSKQLERDVRIACRDMFRERKLLQKIIPDIQKLLNAPEDLTANFAADEDPALPTLLWSPDKESA